MMMVLQFFAFLATAVLIPKGNCYLVMKRTIATEISTSSKKSRISSVASGATKKSPSNLPFNPTSMNADRIRCITQNHELNLQGRCVVYWMSRDQRVQDNYALIYAQEIAFAHNIPIKVVFNLVPKFLQATLRQYSFMLDGLREVESSLRALNVPFHLCMGDPRDTIRSFITDEQPAAVISDFSPLRVGLGWVNAVAESLNSDGIPFCQVDAHNVVPCWIASDKQEYSARTIRSKIHKLLPEFLVPIPTFNGNLNPSMPIKFDAVDWDKALASLEIDRNVQPVSWISPGETAAHNALRSFVKDKLHLYEKFRNDPNQNAQSQLSPYFHFGQLSVQRAVLTVQAERKTAAVDMFVEEAIVRRELSDNFCFCK